MGFRVYFRVKNYVSPRLQVRVLAGHRKHMRFRVQGSGFRVPGPDSWDPDSSTYTIHVESPKVQDSGLGPFRVLKL